MSSADEIDMDAVGYRIDELARTNEPHPDEAQRLRLRANRWARWAITAIPKSSRPALRDCMRLTYAALDAVAIGDGPLALQLIGEADVKAATLGRALTGRYTS